MALDLDALEAGAHKYMEVPESKAIVLELVDRVRRAEAALRWYADLNVHLTGLMLDDHGRRARTYFEEAGDG